MGEQLFMGSVRQVRTVVVVSGSHRDYASQGVIWGESGRGSTLGTGWNDVTELPIV